VRQQKGTSITVNMHSYLSETYDDNFSDDLTDVACATEQSSIGASDKESATSSFDDGTNETVGPNNPEAGFRPPCGRSRCLSMHCMQRAECPLSRANDEAKSYYAQTSSDLISEGNPRGSNCGRLVELAHERSRSSDVSQGSSRDESELMSAEPSR
jgi:hypothetical protein